MTDNSELISLLRQTRASMLGTPDEEVYVNCQEAAHVIEALEERVEKLDNIRIEYIGMINKLVDEREELKKVLKVADEKMERLEQYMDRIQNLIAFFHADIQVALCKDKK